MPIYEYKCPKCGHKFELMRSFNQAHQDAMCPRCQEPARRILSRFASFSVGEGGEAAPVGGGGCGGCTSTGCDTCGA